LFNLETALLGLSRESEDAHVSDLVRRCREIEESGRKGGEERGVGDGHRKDEGRGDEEVEK
jgi:cation transport protein ChaC